MKFTISAVAIFSAALGALAAPPAVAPQPQDVFVPKVLYPHEGTVWAVKSRHNVTWDLSNVPKNISNKFSIHLAKGGVTTPDILVQDGFDPRLGRIEVVVPWVISGNDYQIILYGDSGNKGPMFTIQ